MVLVMLHVCAWLLTVYICIGTRYPLKDPAPRPVLLSLVLLMQITIVLWLVIYLGNFVACKLHTLVFVYGNLSEG